MAHMLTPSDDDIVALYLTGVSRDAVAAKLTVGVTRVRFVLSQRGVMRGRKEASRIACTRYTVNERFFEHIDTLEKCWALGWFYTDGFNRVKRPDARISLNVKDEEVLVKLNALFKNTRPLQREPDYNRITLIVSRTPFSTDLDRHGCVQCKSHILKYPHHLMDTRAKTVAFLRGVLEGDGCICISQRPKQGPYVAVTIASSSRAFVDAWDEVFQSYWGLKGVLQHAKDRPITGIRFEGSREKLRTMLDEVYDLNLFPLYLERKYRKYQEARALLTEMINNSYHQRWSKWGKPKQPTLAGV